MEKKPSTHEEIYSFSGSWVERLLYGLATLAFCAAPFLIPGITVRQGVMLFFGGMIILFLAILVFGLWVSRKQPRGRTR
ncbi:MAG: hypothetical protein DSZ28_03600 [Thiothrix sp.]|nr:MAG: hypothetical protein DSZ28_03600 [Thiothrix sp.]